MASRRARRRGSEGEAIPSLNLQNSSFSRKLVTMASVLSLLLGAALVVLYGMVIEAPASTSLVNRFPNYRDNIGGVPGADYLAYGPIDAVYTWVNGSDPRWKADKEHFHELWMEEMTGVKPTASKAKKDKSNSDNRFRDNEELRYSLRSLEKYAPWLRRIYIVTSGQVPSWLDLDSPRLQIVKHEDIFDNKSHLPVFSSPAIEWNLDNIPGLSESFIYFNDDVFLGAPVYPEDFMTVRKVQKAYFAWEVPECSNGCAQSQLQNGVCDAKCNVTACDFDMGDCGCRVSSHDIDAELYCDPRKVEEILDEQDTAQAERQVGSKLSDDLCVQSCRFAWIGDKNCNRRCNIKECGFDAGACDDGGDFDELYSAKLRANDTLVHVSLEEGAVMLDLSKLFPSNYSRIEAAEHNNERLVRHASVFEEDMKLLVVFGRDFDGHRMTGGVSFTVHGKKGTLVQSIVKEDEENDRETVETVDEEDVSIHFTLVRGQQPLASSGSVTFLNSTIRPKRIRLPFNFTSVSIDRLADQTSGVQLDFSGDAAGGNQSSETSIMHARLQLPFDIMNKVRWSPGDIFLLDAIAGFWPRSIDRDEVDEREPTWTDDHSCLVNIPDNKPTRAEEEQPHAPNHQHAEEAKKAGSGSTDKTGASVSFGDLEHNDDDDEVGAWMEEDEMMGVRDKNQEETLDTDETSCRVSTDSSGIAMDFQLPLHPSQMNASDSVIDGRVCFGNADDEIATRKIYCIDFALVPPHTHVLHAVHLRTIQRRLEELERQAELIDSILYLEGEESCWDISLEILHISPPICNVHDAHAWEVAYNRAPVDSTDDHESDEETQASEEAGKILACDAQERRHRRAKERASNASTIDVLRNLFQSSYRYILHITGLSIVESSDALEDDVCVEEESKSSGSKTHKKQNIQPKELSRDTFGDSLRFANNLYNRVFGKPVSQDPHGLPPSRRRVPSHMPFMLQRSKLNEIKQNWPLAINATSSHRFRHPQDMQFSFSYFHFLLNRHKLYRPSLEDVWHEYLDVNRNGFLDENEILTLASLSRGDIPSDEFLEDVKTCIQPPKQEKVREVTTAKGTLRLSETLIPHITLNDLRSCPNVTSSLLTNVRNEPSAVALDGESEVTFHMLSENFRFAWGQMLGTRARRTKFVCINDDMKNPSERVSRILHELFLSIWPKPSQFELPSHLRNRYDHIDDYKAAKEWRQGGIFVFVIILSIAAFVFRRDIQHLVGFQEYARARAESASQLSQELEEERERVDKEVKSGDE